MSDQYEPAAPPVDMETVRRLSRDLRNAARTMSPHEARFLVDAYYAMQKDRIRTGNRVAAMNKTEEPHDVMSWIMEQKEILERQVAGALDKYSAAQPLGEWARSIVGIGPVIAAGLLAHINVTRNTKQNPEGLETEYPGLATAGHVWRYAGLDPTVKWGKGEKQPWNAQLKRLCFIIGESFVKFSGNERDIYGKFYVTRKLYEIAKNEAGDYAAQAAVSLATKNYGLDTMARGYYERGKLPPARIHLRAKRVAVKLFLAHYHHVAYEMAYGKAPPRPYVFDHLEGHVHYIAPPNWPMK